MSLRQTIWLLAMPLMVTGCVLAPRGTKELQQQLADAGPAYTIPVSERSIPDLGPQPTWRDLLAHAFLANGQLEAAYFEWQAAVSRIDVAAGYPNSNVSVGFEYLFSGDNLKGWDRTTLSVGFDPTQNLSFPTKVLAAGRVALDDARVAASRLRASKFSLQQQVLTAYFQYALLGERIRLRRELVDLLRLTAAAARIRADAGAAQQGAVIGLFALHSEETKLLDAQADVIQQRALLNTLLGRADDSRLELPGALPDARPLLADDAQLLAVGVAQNPELEALAHASTGREHALELARLQYLPDINPFAGLTGSMEQVVGAAITVSTMLPQIRARIVESEAMLRASEAALRQAKVDRAGSYVATLVALRNYERQASVLGNDLLPMAQLSGDLARQMYVAGAGGITPVLEGQRAVVEVRMALAEARIAREIKLVELEMLAGVDIETIGSGATVAALAEER